MPGLILPSKILALGDSASFRSAVAPLEDDFKDTIAQTVTPPPVVQAPAPLRLPGQSVSRPGSGGADSAGGSGSFGLPSLSDLTSGWMGGGQQPAAEPPAQPAPSYGAQVLGALDDWIPSSWKPTPPQPDIVLSGPGNASSGASWSPLPWGSDAGAVPGQGVRRPGGSMVPSNVLTAARAAPGLEPSPDGEIVPANIRALPRPAVDTTQGGDAVLRQLAPSFLAVEQSGGPSARNLGALVLAENGGGQSQLSRVDNNYFSISHVPGRVHQAGPGSGGRFARYEDPNASLADFVDLIKTAPRYAEAWRLRNAPPEHFFGALAKAGYIVPEAGFPVETWLANTAQGATRFDRAAAGAAPAALPGGRTGPATAGEPGGPPLAAGPVLGGPTTLQGITPPQFGLGDADADAICGPVLAMAFAKANGRNATIAEAKQMAATHGRWTSAAGMGGPEAMAQTLRAMNIPAHYAPGALDTATIRRETQNGNPVGINTRDHYFVVEGVDDQGRLDLGNSAKALRASGGRQWFRPEEIEGLGMGAPTGAIYKDSPASPTPSVAVQATAMPTVSRADAPAQTGPTILPAAETIQRPATFAARQLQRAQDGPLVASTEPGVGYAAPETPTVAAPPVRDDYRTQPTVPEFTPSELGSRGDPNPEPVTYTAPGGPLSGGATQAGEPSAGASPQTAPAPEPEFTPSEAEGPSLWQGVQNAASTAGQSIQNAVSTAGQAISDAYAVPADQRPPQYSGPSYAQPSVPEGQRPYFAPTEAESAGVQSGIAAAQDAAPLEQIPIPFTGSAIPVPPMLQRPAGRAAGVLETVQAGENYARARLDPRVWAFAKDGIRRELFTEEELAHEAVLRGTMDPVTGARHTNLTPDEVGELQAMDQAVEQRYQEIKDDPDALTRYAQASPAYLPTSALTDIALTSAVGPLAAGAATRAAGALGAGARTARAIGYGADIAAQTAVDPTTPFTQGPFDLATAGVRGAARLPGRLRSAADAGAVDVAGALPEATPVIRAIPDVGETWEDVSRRLAQASDEATARAAAEMPPRPVNDQLIREQYGRPWQEVAPTGPSAISTLGEATDQLVTEGRALRTPRGQVRPSEVEEIGGPVRIEPQSINLNASAGALPPALARPDRLAQVNRAIAEPLVGSMTGATTGYALPADSEEERRQHGLAGGLLGMAGLPLGTRALRRVARAAGAADQAGGALVSAGGLPARLRPPAAALDPARVAAEEAAGPARGARLNQPLAPEGSRIPLGVRAVQALTDDQAALRWAEDILTQDSGRGKLPEDAAERASALRRRNPDSISDQRIRDELAPVVARAQRQGLLDEVVQHLQDTHEQDVLTEFYRRGHAEAIDAGKTTAEAEAAGMARMEQRSAANPDLSYEAVSARLAGQADRLGPERLAEVQDLAQGVWDHNRATLDRMQEAGRISADQHAWLTDTYPHYVPTVPVSHLDPGGGRAAVGRGAGVSAGRSGPGDVTAFEDVASGSERLNPIVASRDATIARERVAHRNEVFQAFAKLYDEAGMSGSQAAQPSQGPKRLRFAGEAEASGRVDGEPVTIRVPRPIADGIDTLGQMGGGGGALGLWRAAMSAVTTSITGRRAAFLPVNLARDFGDSLLRAGAQYGVGALPEYLGLWFREAGNAAVDLAHGAVTGRLPVTGRAKTYLRRGGGMGNAEGGWQKGQEWYDDVRRTGGVVVSGQADLLPVMRDLLTFKPVMAANERTELISRTAMMDLAERRGAGATESMIAGRNASIDFQRAGSVVRMFNGAIPFLNATVQSGAQLARTVRDNPKSAAATFATVVGVPVVAAEAYNRSDPTRAAAYDDVPQYLKDEGIVVMLPWAGSDTRGERPNYLWLPLGMGAPVAVAIREAMAKAPGLEPSAGRADLPPDASTAERWAQVAGQVFSVFSPIKGDTLGAAASSMIPPGVKQIAELGMNRNLYTGSPIASDLADERASAFSRAGAGLANQAGRAVGSDFLQEVRPSQIDYLARQLPAYGDVITGASDMLAPSAAKQAEDRPIANAPLVGGAASRIVRDVGGADLDRARGEILSPTIREAIGEAGLRPSDIQGVPASLSVDGQTMPLMRDEQVRYQERTNTYADREVGQAMRAPEWRRPAADREQLVRDAMARGRQRAADELLRGIPASERARRIRESAG